MESAKQREESWSALLALGFSPTEVREKHGVIVHKNLFVSANVLGMEVVMHYLLVLCNADNAKVFESCFFECWL